MLTRNHNDTDGLDHWQQAFDASPDLISILDKDHRILAINDTMAKALGCRPEEALGQKCCHLVHQSDKPPSGCPHLCLLEDSKPHQCELFDENLNMWLLVSVTPLFDDNGRLTGSIHIATNINDIKNVEQALRESQDRYRHLSEATQEGVLLSAGHTILAFNQVLAHMTGYEADELKGKSLLKFVSPHDHRRIADYLKSDHKKRIELACIRKDGTQFPIEAHCRLVSFQGKMVYQTAIRDLTEEKRIHQERSERERLQGVLEMAGAVSHEINQPLTAIYGYLDLLALQLPADSRETDRINHIEAQLKRIESITHKLNHITQYKTKTYAGGEKIIDLDKASLDNHPDTEPD